MLTEDQTPVRLCPLDGSATEPFDDGFVVCTSCREILRPDETVTQATQETWSAYLLAGTTDTDPDAAPLSKLIRSHSVS